MDGTMSRHTRSRSAKFLTLAGLTFLSGCSGASSDPATGALFDAGQATAASDATSSKAPRPLAAKHTIDGRVLPVWYPFEDPPMPALLPADGPADGPATGSTQPMSPDAAADSQPTIVLPTDNADTVRRLPPTDGDSAAEPATDRYGVDSRYDLDAAQHGTGEDAHDYPRDYSPDRSVPDRDAEPSPRNELDAPTRQYEPPQSSPLVEPPLASPSAEPPHSNERMQRLPPVEEHSAENHAAENNAIEPNTSPQDHESSTYNRRYAEDALAPPPQPDLSRPSEALADEARPVGRFERLTAGRRHASRFSAGCRNVAQQRCSIASAKLRPGNTVRPAAARVRQRAVADCRGPPAAAPRDGVDQSTRRRSGAARL